MEEIIQILMKRDDLTHEEATDLVQECKDELKQSLENDEGLDSAEQIVADTLGLEPDYLFALLP
jgi:hypothetical protein